MKKTIFTLCSLLLLAPLAVQAQTNITDEHVTGDRIPPTVLVGLQAYKTMGPEVAVAAWVKGGPLEGSDDANHQVNELQEMQNWYGDYRGYEFLSFHELTPRIHITYLAIDFAKGPVYVRFDTFHADAGWVVTDITLNAKPELVLPAFGLGWK
jgi:hypothetical protein